MTAYARRVVARLRGEESGQTVVLVIGFAVVLLLAVTVVTNASAAFLARRSLATWADGAALAAAQGVRHEAVYTGEVADVLPLAQARAAREVVAYAARHGLAGRFRAFRVTVVRVDAAAGQVSVEFAASVPLPFLNDLSTGYSAGVPVRASATALAPLS